MQKITLLIILMLAATCGQAQSGNDSSMDVKVGLGATFWGTGDIYIGKLEGELTKKWNNYFSNSVSLNVGYGDSPLFAEYVFQRTFISHLDGNVFLSPFGNQHVYNLKIGTGFSLMYVSDQQQIRYPKVRYINTGRRASIGLNMIVENEFTISKTTLFGIKTIMQPYLNGDIGTTLLFKLGKKL